MATLGTFFQRIYHSVAARKTLTILPRHGRWNLVRSKLWTPEATNRRKTMCSTKTLNVGDAQKLDPVGKGFHSSFSEQPVENISDRSIISPAIFFVESPYFLIIVGEIITCHGEIIIYSLHSFIFFCLPPLVNKHSYWKRPIEIVDLAIKNGDFP